MILTTKIGLATNPTVVPPNTGDPTDPTTPLHPDNYEAYPKDVSGPSTVLSAAEAVFTIDNYYQTDKRIKGKLSERVIATPSTAEQVIFDIDKNVIKWVFWVSGGLMDAKGEHIVIQERALKNEATSNYTNTNNKTTFKNNVAENGYLEAVIETITEAGIKKNQLRIKFSKWLDGRTIHVEAYRNDPDHVVTRDYVKSTSLNAATPEVVDMYWLNTQNERVTSTGFETTVSLCIETLGLRNKKVDFSLSDTEDLLNTINWNGTPKKRKPLPTIKQ